MSKRRRSYYFLSQGRSISDRTKEIELLRASKVKKILQDISCSHRSYQIEVLNLLGNHMPQVLDKG